jgi:hypothetical protein
VRANAQQRGTSARPAAGRRERDLDLPVTIVRSHSYGRYATATIDSVMAVRTGAEGACARGERRENNSHRSHGPAKAVMHEAAGGTILLVAPGAGAHAPENALRGPALTMNVGCHS